MAYNADNRRISLVQWAATTKFVSDAVTDAYVTELDGSNVLVASYTNEPQQYGGVLSQRRRSTSRFLHADALGTTRLLTSTAGATTDTYLFDAWGNPVSSTGSTVNPFRWVGRYGYYTDSATGLLYVRARMYAPIVARWVSADPIGFLDGINLYQNVRNAPIALFDSTGLFLARVHTQITEVVVNAWISGHVMSEAWEQWIRSVVTCCNLAKDFGSAFNSLEQHFNRPFAGNDESWGARISAGRKADTAYGAYLSSEQSKLDSQIEHSDCYQALCTMGRLSHSYQDFYAHAVRVDQGGTTFYVNVRPPAGDMSKPVQRLGSLVPWRNTRGFDGREGSENSVWPGFSAFEHGVTANPESRLGFMPSSYEYGQEGEHPENTEPIRVGSVEERLRIQHAQLYSQIKLHYYLEEWWQRCQCPCPQAGQPCTLIRPGILESVPWELLGVPEYCPRQ